MRIIFVASAIFGDVGDDFCCSCNVNAVSYM